MATRVRKHLEELMDKDPALRAEYDALGPRFSVISELIRVRRARNVSQAELGRRMGRSQQTIARLESAEHDPRLGTLVEAADALGYELDVKFKRRRKLG